MTGNANTTRGKRSNGRRLPLRLFLFLFAILGLLILGALATLILKSRMPGKALPLISSTPSTSAINDLPPPPTIDEPSAADQPVLAANQFRFFFTDDGAKLRPQVAQMTTLLEGQERLRYVLEELLKGPATDALKSPLPQAVELRGAYMVGDMVVVDFSSPILKPLGGISSELLCVYSIVNTVIENIRGARTVRILVEGQPRSVLWEQVDISAGLSKDVSLIQYQ